MNTREYDTARARAVLGMDQPTKTFCKRCAALHAVVWATIAIMYVFNLYIINL